MEKLMIEIAKQDLSKCACHYVVVSEFNAANSAKLKAAHAMENQALKDLRAARAKLNELYEAT